MRVKALLHAPSGTKSGINLSFFCSLNSRNRAVSCLAPPHAQVHREKHLTPLPFLTCGQPVGLYHKDINELDRKNLVYLCLEVIFK